MKEIFLTAGSKTHMWQENPDIVQKMLDISTFRALYEEQRRDSH